MSVDLLLLIDFIASSMSNISSVSFSSSCSVSISFMLVFYKKVLCQNCCSVQKIL